MGRRIFGIAWTALVIAGVLIFLPREHWFVAFLGVAAGLVGGYYANQLKKQKDASDA